MGPDDDYLNEKNRPKLIWACSLCWDLRPNEGGIININYSIGKSYNIFVLNYTYKLKAFLNKAFNSKNVQFIKIVDYNGEYCGEQKH